MLEIHPIPKFLELILYFRAVVKRGGRVVMLSIQDSIPYNAKKNFFK